MPYLYESTSVETVFTDLRDPEPRSRPPFVFRQPATLAAWAACPPLLTAHLWPAQVEAITNLEQSIADNRPCALIQVATGGGKTFTAMNFVYRLIKHAWALEEALAVQSPKENDHCS